MPLDRLTMRADWRCRPAIASVRISCAAESCCALPMQPGERWSCRDRCRWMRCSCDDPPDVNCRAKSYSAADHLINPRQAYSRHVLNLGPFDFQKFSFEFQTF